MATTHKPLRLGVIGCGGVVEQCHLPAILPLAELQVVALADTDGAGLNRIANRLGVDRRYSDYRTMLQQAPIDAVAVCTPPAWHTEMGLAVLDAGKHLFIEKPLAVSLADGERLLRRATGSRCTAMAGFNLRWHRLVRRARSLIDSGALGTPETMHTVFASRTGFLTPRSAWRRRPESGGGVLLDLGMHHFDLWRWLLHAEVEEVFARCRSDATDVDCVTVSARMSNGALASGCFSRGLSDTNEVRITGRKRQLRLSCYRIDSLQVSDHAAPQGAAQEWYGRLRRALTSMPRLLATGRHGGDMLRSYRAAWRHFVDVVRHGRPLECTVADAYHALQVALAAEESAGSGRPVQVATVAGTGRRDVAGGA